MVALEALGTVLAYLALWALSYRVAARIVNWRRTPRELRGDWWPRFERDLNDYLARLESGQAGARRPGGGGTLER